MSLSSLISIFKSLSTEGLYDYIALAVVHLYFKNPASVLRVLFLARKYSKTRYPIIPYLRKVRIYNILIFFFLFLFILLRNFMISHEVLHDLCLGTKFVIVWFILLPGILLNMSHCIFLGIVSGDYRNGKAKRWTWSWIKEGILHLNIFASLLIKMSCSSGWYHHSWNFSVESHLFPLLQFTFHIHDYLMCFLQHGYVTCILAYVCLNCGVELVMSMGELVHSVTSTP